jgi:hypothetical protein
MSAITKYGPAVCLFHDWGRIHHSHACVVGRQRLPPPSETDQARVLPTSFEAGPPAGMTPLLVVVLY